MRVRSWRPKICACTQNWRVGARCPWSMPLGVLVVPELKITRAGSSGDAPSMRCVELARPSRRRRPARNASPRVLALDPSEPRRGGRCGQVGLQRGEVVAEVAGPGGASWVRATVTSACSSIWASSGRGAKVDIGHDDGAGHRGAEQRRHGLGPVPHEDADGIAALHSQREERPAGATGLAEQVRVGPAHGGAVAERVVEHQGVVGGVAVGDLGEERRPS